MFEKLKKLLRKSKNVSTTLQDSLPKYITKTIRNSKLKVVVDAVPTAINDKELGFTFYLTNSKGEIEFEAYLRLDSVIKYSNLF